MCTCGDDEVIKVLTLTGHDGEFQVTRGRAQHWKNCQLGNGNPGDAGCISAAEVFERVWNFQNGVCPISGKPLHFRDKDGCVVDCDPDTGMFRGLVNGHIKELLILFREMSPNPEDYERIASELATCAQMRDQQS